LLVYRTDKYKKLQAEVDKHSRKLEKQRDTTSENKIDKAAKKRLGMLCISLIALMGITLGRQEERLKVFTRDLNAVKIKSMLATAVIFTSLFSVCSSVFDGRVVCKLPFTPISWLYGMSHRNLHGNDFTDCSFIFLYIICTMSIRQNVQKMLGFSPSRAANQSAYGSSS
uniref:Calcium load-activated calcium channel n=1 Tax=Hydatigena taeniaeformis TaxID=6205 RepID=A0A0R3WZR1_HYDTA